MNTHLIIPAVLAKDYHDLKEHLALVRGLVPWVQIDVCDGKFVPSECWPYSKGQYDGFFQTILSEEEGLPFWKDLDFEIDLMVENPENVISDWITAGASRVILHIESFVSETAKNEFFEKCGSSAPASSVFSGIEIGLAIDIDTPNENLAPFMKKLQSVACIQCMGIKNDGFQGEEFDLRVLEKISILKKLYPDIIISVDGGVNFETARKLIKAGANRLVSGSQIFDSTNIVESIEHLKNL